MSKKKMEDFLSEEEIEIVFRRMKIPSVTVKVLVLDDKQEAIAILEKWRNLDIVQPNSDKQWFEFNIMGAICQEGDDENHSENCRIVPCRLCEASRWADIILFGKEKEEVFSSLLQKIVRDKTYVPLEFKGSLEFVEFINKTFSEAKLF